QQFTAAAADQFSTTLATQPSFTWSVSGGGRINGAGLFTAGLMPGSGFTVSAAAGGRAGAAAVSVVSNGGFIAAINFQPANAPTVPGYFVDSGALYADRG